MSSTPEQDPPAPEVPVLAGGFTRRQMLRTAIIGGVAVAVAGCVDRESPLEPETPEQPGNGGVDAQGDGSEPFMSELKWVSFNFPPKGWALANGQFLPINQNQALFALLGTTYGGNGQTNFQLPNLRGRVPIHMGNGHTLGEAAGSTSVTINAQTMAPHTHQMQASSNSTNVSADPTGHVLAPVNGLYSISAHRMYRPDAKDIPADAVRISVPTFANFTPGSLGPLNSQSVTSVGGSQPHNNMQPYLVLNCIIALQGIFPSQN
jgi:microcystin-dependent protein